MTNPAYFALNARRRIDLYGATAEDFANVKVKNAKHGLNNPNARYRKEVTVENVLASPVVSNPLHLLDICATSDGGAAILLTSMEYARKMGIAEPVRIKAISTVTPTFPQTIMDMPNFSTDSSSAVPAPERTFKESIATPHTKRPGSLPRTSTSPKSTTSLPPWNWTGSKTLPSASGARPSTSCVRVTPVLEAASRSIRPAVSRASAKPFPHRHLRRCASSLGSFVDRPKAVRSKAPHRYHRQPRSVRTRLLGNRFRLTLFYFRGGRTLTRERPPRSRLPLPLAGKPAMRARSGVRWCSRPSGLP